MDANVVGDTGRDDGKWRRMDARGLRGTTRLDGVNVVCRHLDGRGLDGRYLEGVRLLDGDVGDAGCDDWGRFDGHQFGGVPQLDGDNCGFDAHYLDGVS